VSRDRRSQAVPMNALNNGCSRARSITRGPTMRTGAHRSCAAEALKSAVETQDIDPSVLKEVAVETESAADPTHI
jgi:hypothetical protein